MKTIPIDEEIKRFEKHLENNFRIIFSAKFGDGKTYFLNAAKEQLKDKYRFITLHPINYSVLDNQDVFEYIKYDIIKELKDYVAPLYKETLLKDKRFHNYKEIINIGAIISSSLLGISGLSEISEEFQSIIQDYKNNKSTFEKYSDAFLSQKGGLYEHDTYTQMIELALDLSKRYEKIDKKVISKIKDESYKTQKEIKKNVLVIEDLDRIDPKHLFRILNVFGAHIDHPDSPNKFGFDNIVFVMHYDTAKHIFHHFYGIDAGYDGYMSKFISHYPYSYSIKQVAQDFVYSFVEKECGLQKKDISQFTIRQDNATFDEVLKEKSVRDIVNIFENFENQYENHEITLSKYTINTDVPIVKFLALIKRLCQNKISIDGITNAITNKEPIETLNFIGGFLLVNKALESHEIFSYKNQYFQISYNPQFIIKPCTSSYFINLVKINNSHIKTSVIRTCQEVHDLLIEE